jgi:hypothetical protein
VPAPGDYDNGEFGGMIGKGNRSTAPVPLCPPQIPHALLLRSNVVMQIFETFRRNITPTFSTGVATLQIRLASAHVNISVTSSILYSSVSKPQTANPLFSD